MAVTIDQIVQEFDREIAGDQRVRSLMEQVNSGKATYADASELSSLTGRKLGRILADAIGNSEVPDDRIRLVLDRSCLANYNVVSDAVEKVQKSLNERAGIGLKPVVPEFNRSRVDGIASEIERRGADAVVPTLPSQIENQSMGIVDDAVQQNADFQYRAGLSPKIVRTAESKCCEWCDNLAGTYSYPCDKQVYRRHQNCRCVVEYDPGTGKVQNAHTKRTYSRDESAIANRINNNLSTGKNEDDKIESGRGFANGPRRGALTIVSEEEQQRIYRTADELLIPRDILVFNAGSCTSFDEDSGFIFVRGDIFPSPYASNVDSILSERCALAHEYYGHYLSAPSRFPMGDWRDEFSASYKAAIITPNLSDDDRRLLMIDAFDRAKEAGVTVTYNRTARKLIYGND